MMMARMSEISQAPPDADALVLLLRSCALFLFSCEVPRPRESEFRVPPSLQAKASKQAASSQKIKQEIDKATEPAN